MTTHTLQDLLRAPHMRHGTYAINDRPVTAEAYADAQIDYMSASELVHALSDALETLLAPAPTRKVIKFVEMTEKAEGRTQLQFLEAGWTDDQLIAHGYMRERP